MTEIQKKIWRKTICSKIDKIMEQMDKTTYTREREVLEKVKKGVMRGSILPSPGKTLERNLESTWNALTKKKDRKKAERDVKTTVETIEEMYFSDKYREESRSDS